MTTIILYALIVFFAFCASCERSLRKTAERKYKELYDRVENVVTNSVGATCSECGSSAVYAYQRIDDKVIGMACIKCGRYGMLTPHQADNFKALLRRKVLYKLERAEKIQGEEKIDRLSKKE